MLTVFGIVLMVGAVPELPILWAARAPELAIAEPHGEFRATRDRGAVADLPYLPWRCKELCRRNEQAAISPLASHQSAVCMDTLLPTLHASGELLCEHHMKDANHDVVQGCKIVSMHLPSLLAVLLMLPVPHCPCKWATFSSTMQTLQRR